MGSVQVEVSLCDILRYIGDRSQLLEDGEAVFKAGHIILCGIENLSKTEKITALCLQTSSLTSKPHEITVILHEDVAKWNCCCSCKVGLSGFCKHIIATLIYINRQDTLNLVSCTDLAQKWGKEKKGVEAELKALPFKEFCHPLNKRKKLNFNSSPSLNSENFDRVW